jgi:hypothetical protein
MNREQAVKLLERLRMRTEARGATAAEAAAAAELAEKIIQRYGLDRNATATSTESHVLGQNRLPSYAAVLAQALIQRFKCDGDYLFVRGQRTIVRFHGPEHTCRVACWMFAAIIKDLDRLSAQYVHASGATGLRLRNRFRLGAAWEVHWRLNPPAQRALAEATEKETVRRRPRNCRRREIRDTAEWEAVRAGREAGQQIKLSTDVLGGSAPERLRLC